MPNQLKTVQVAKVVHLEPESQRLKRASIAQLPLAVSAAHEKGSKLLQSKFREFFDKVDDSLFELADKADSSGDQSLFFEAMRVVRVQRRAMESGFSASIDEAFTSMMQAEGVARTDSFEALTADALSLVQHDELEEMVAIDASVIRANKLYGEQIQHIALRFDSLVPVKVYQKNNPFGPDVVSSAFMKEAKKLGIDIKAKLVLYKLFDKTLLAQMGDLYNGVNQVLIENNILPSLATARGTRERRSASAGGVARTAANSRTPSSANVNLAASNPQQAAKPSALAPDSNPEVLNILKSLLGEQVVAPTQKVSTSGDNTVNELLRLLTQAQQMMGRDNAQEGVASVDVRSLLSQLHITDKGRVGRVDDEVMNLVNMLFDFILEDRNLAAPMKAVLSRMQIPIIKVAVADKSFFTKGGHVARRLLNEMATAAIGWQGDSKTCKRDPLYRQIDGIVRNLIDNFDTDISIFDKLFNEFSTFLDKEKRRAAVLERRILDAEDGKAKAEAARSVIAVEVELRTAELAIPDVVNELIEGPWCNYLFLSILKHGYESKEVEEALLTLEELAWSVQAPQIPAQRQRLIRVVPNLLKKLRTGLDTISYNPFEMSNLFKSLESVHLACIRGTAIPGLKKVEPKKPEAKKAPEPSQTKKVAERPAAPANVRVKPEVRAQVAPTPAQVPVQKTPEVVSKAEAPSEVSAEKKVEMEAYEAVAKDASGNPILPHDDLYVRQVSHFVQGTWFDMDNEKGIRIRCRLAAFIKPTGKYIYVNRNGMKVAEKTQNELAHALKNNTLRALDNSTLFDRALETVVSSLRASQTRI
ncbi:MAG: hypothetical protein COA42_10650 [Alteromonadaceae bacterium]|nr:MAG: hypothetical protein COA42_10650 [Alteromonadaceae bacterium]